MKKIIAIILVTVLSVLALSACSYLPVDYELSLGVAVTEAEGKTTETYCALLTDASGRIVLCRIDSTDFSPIGEGTKAPLSKKALGDDYNMMAYTGGKAVGEWYEQAAYYERALVGKTLDEAMLLVTGADELKVGCTIDVTDFAKAVKAAFESESKEKLSHFGDVSIALTAGAAIVDGSYVSSVSAVALYRAYTLADVISISKVTVTPKAA